MASFSNASPIITISTEPMTLHSVACNISLVAIQEIGTF